MVPMQLSWPRGLCVVIASICIGSYGLGQLVSNHADGHNSSGEIQRVENGLLPAAFVKGMPAAPMRLMDRMFVYQVTGVSIAVIHNGAIAWSRGFGYTRLGGPPVTSDTLFQVASISKPVTATAALRLVQSGKSNWMLT